MLDEIFRDEWGRVVAALVGFLRDIELAEDAAQEAFAVAAERWPRDGVPASPAAWLITTARNRAIDRIRRERRLTEKTALLARELADPELADPELANPELANPREDTMDDTTTFPDERLELIFMCCHPALALDAQVGLTLRTLGGLSTEEIARAFLVPFETISKRLDPCEAQDPRCRDSLRRPGGSSAPRAAGRRSRRRVPDLQRGLGRRTRSTLPPRRSVLGGRSWS